MRSLMIVRYLASLMAGMSGVALAQVSTPAVVPTPSELAGKRDPKLSAEPPAPLPTQEPRRASWAVWTMT